MFRFKNLKPADVVKISAVKENNFDMFLHAADAAGGNETNLTMPHDSYIIGLSSLQSEDEPDAVSVGTRVIEATEDKFGGIYDLIHLGNLNTQLQVVRDADYIKEYEVAFESILNTPMEEEGFEVRNVKIPALHVDALWLHKDSDPGSDVYVPVKTMGIFTENKVYEKNVFFEMLKDAAKDYDMNDELLGG